MQWIVDLSSLPAVAAEIAQHLRGVVALYGEMGVGKTTLVSALMRAMGSPDYVSSPTFSIVNEYSTGQGSVFHFDFYRISSPKEAFDLGYEEYFFSGHLCLVEWPERISGLLPSDALSLTIELLPTGRRLITLSD